MDCFGPIVDNLLEKLILLHCIIRISFKKKTDAQNIPYIKKYISENFGNFCISETVNFFKQYLVFNHLVSSFSWQFFKFEPFTYFRLSVLFPNCTLNLCQISIGLNTSLFESL